MAAGNLAPLGTVTETEHGFFCAFIRLRTLRDLAVALAPQGGCLVVEHHYRSPWDELPVPLGLGIDLLIDCPGRGDPTMLASHRRVLLEEGLARIRALAEAS